MFAFGIMAHEILTRKHPFEEFNYKHLYLLEEAVQKGIRPSIPPAQPAEFVQLMTDCWHTDPEKRYADV